MPTGVLYIGLNYRKHAEESGAQVPEQPILFMKLPSAVQDLGRDIVLPRRLRSDQVDYEAGSWPS